MMYRMGWSETENGTINWEDYAATAQGFVEMFQRVAGRYIFLEVYSAALNTDWELISIEMQGRLGGSR